MARESIISTRRITNVSDVKMLRVVDLLVDEDNFRLEPNPDQPATIKAMLRKQGKKLVALAEDIVRVGLSRGEFIWVAPDPRPECERKYVVCEGNRRITALKLLSNPTLAEGTTWSKRFRDLGIEYRKNRIPQVRGVLYPSIEAARDDVYRRHTNDQDGKGLEAWDPFAQDRANKAQKTRRNLSMVVMEHLTTSTIEALAEQLGLTERTTNADRLLSTFSKAKASKYGIGIRVTHPYNVDLGRNPEQGARILERILSASAVSVDAIKTEAVRNTLLDDLLSSVGHEASNEEASTESSEQDGSPEDLSLPNAGGSPGEPDRSENPSSGSSGQGDARGEDENTTNNGRGRGSGRDPLERTTLAPVDRAQSLRVSGVRLPGLYKECKQLNVDERPNAAAMLLRVFLELSCEAYLEHHHVRPPGSRGDWSAYGINLDTKILKALSRLDPTENARDLQDARNGVSEDLGQSHSIRALHRAMHDRHHVLNPREIKLAWQRWHPLLKRIHDSI